MMAGGANPQLKIAIYIIVGEGFGATTVLIRILYLSWRLKGISMINFGYLYIFY